MNERKLFEVYLCGDWYVVAALDEDEVIVELIKKGEIEWVGELPNGDLIIHQDATRYQLIIDEITFDRHAVHKVSY